MDYTYSPEFRYKSRNPYNDKLAGFTDFVMRDNDAEAFSGRWGQDVFGRQSPLCVEIGTGYGDFMIDYCARYPHVNFVGMDYRFRRSFELARKLSKIDNKNFRYLRARGERIKYMFSEGEVDSIFYFFPDPWPKTRHHKKRLFQKTFLESAYQVLRPQGKIFIKTDHDGYADWMEKEISQTTLFRPLFATRDLRLEHPEHFLSGFQTKFEKIFIAQGTKIKAYVLESTRPLNAGIKVDERHQGLPTIV